MGIQIFLSRVNQKNAVSLNAAHSIELRELALVRNKYVWPVDQRFSVDSSLNFNTILNLVAYHIYSGSKISCLYSLHFPKPVKQPIKFFLFITRNYLVL